MLVEHMTLDGALQTLFLLLAVWWVWMYTCWFTNWIDPDKPTVRMLLFALMLAGLLMSAAIPNAFGHEGLLFAIAYSFIQVTRSAFMVFATRLHDPVNHRNFQRITAWLAVSAVFWIAGGIAGGYERVAAWVFALSLEIGGPFVGYFVPGIGRSNTTDWKVMGAHGRALRAVRHDRARRVHPGDRRHRRIAAGDHPGVCAFLRIPRQRGRGGSTSTSAPSAAAENPAR
jgi:low temperature requirement protein LtrA